MIRDACEVIGEAELDRAADAVVAALVGDPVRCVLAGTVVLWALGHWIGWWLVAAIAVAGLGDTIWCTTRLLRRQWPW